MKVNFTKMTGLGNDYVYFNCLKGIPEGLIEKADKISDRRFGVGGDGIVLICSSDIADAKMRMFNLDGSEGKMCGNAIRCVGKYLYENGLCKKENISIETLSGIKYLELSVKDGLVNEVTVDMGSPELQCKNVPCVYNNDTMINALVNINNKDYYLTAVSMGNPHAVIFKDEIDSIDVEKLSFDLQHSSVFPEGVNVEYVQFIDKKLVKMRVCERGSGETFACGTGACATVVALVENGKCSKNDWISVILLGGTLQIKYTDKTVFMKGTAQKVFDGEIELNNF